MQDLGKWPRLLVLGNRVTRDQASEILLRTNQWLMGTNDRAWVHEVGKIVGLPVGRYNHFDGEAVRAFEQRHDVLQLSYLHNHQIASAFIGGPHGWCTWDGQIGCAVYNLGKYPTVEDVTQDWELIASAFPFLRLRAQLVPEEGEAGFPAVEWRVAGGRVELDLQPRELLRPPLGLDEIDIVAQVMFAGAERGVSPKRLAEAMDVLRSRRAEAVADQ